MNHPSETRPAGAPAAAARTTRANACGGWARATQPRLCILACLIGSDEALTHRAVLDRIPATGEAIDRVTVYRVLDWLVEQGRRRSAPATTASSASAVEHEAARAQSIAGTAISTARAATAPSAGRRQRARRAGRPRVPSGFAVEHVELTVNGICAECGARTEPARQAAPAQPE